MLSIKKCSIAFFCFLFLVFLIVATGCTDEDAPVAINSEPSRPALSSGSDATALVSNAWALNAKEKFSDAIAALDRAETIDPATPGIAFNRGWALTGLGKYSEALPVLDQALAENPDSVISWSNKGYCLANLGRCQEAVSAYTMASELEPSNLAIRQSLDSMEKVCTNAKTQPPTTRPASGYPAGSTTTVATARPMGFSSPDGLLTQSYQDSRISLKYPANWNIQKETLGSASYDVVSLSSENGIVWVYSGKTDTAATLDDHQASQMASWAKYTNFYLVSREQATLAGNPALATTYTWTDPGGNQQETYAVVSVIGNRAYIAYFTESPPSSFPASLPLGKSIIDSLQVIQAAPMVSATSQPAQSYRDNRISLKYPTGWTYKTDVTGLTGYDEVTFYSPGNTLLVDFYGDRTGTLLTLEGIQAAQMDSLKSHDTDFTLLSTEKTTLAGNPAIGSTYTWTSPKGNPQKTYLVVSVINGKRWYVYYVTDPDSYQANLAVAKSIINSFIPLSDRTVDTP